MTFFGIFYPENLRKLLNGHWNVPAIQQHSVGLNVHWKVTEQCLKSGFQWTFREQSVDIQVCFSWLKGEFSSCELAIQNMCRYSLCKRIYRIWIKFLRYVFKVGFLTMETSSLMNKLVCEWPSFVIFYIRLNHNHVIYICII